MAIAIQQKTNGILSNFQSGVKVNLVYRSIARDSKH